MRFDSSVINTKDSSLEVGKNYIYKESMPTELILFRLDGIKEGDEKHGPDWIELEVTYLKSLYSPEMVGRQDSLGFRNGERCYYGGMWRIYDEGAYSF